MATITRGERRAFGPIVNDIGSPASTYRQVGGTGLCRWKMLMNGMHLEGAWNCVEHVVITPGAAVGSHTHVRTEEIYYIVSGRAVVTMNGAPMQVGQGDLVTTPIGAEHSIANPYDEDMCFFVTEVFPGTGAAAEPARLNVPELLRAAGGSRTEVDLTPYFTGPWRRLRLVEVLPGDTVTDDGASGHSRVGHVLNGRIRLALDGVETEGDRGYSFAAPPGYPYTVLNTGTESLRFIVVEVAP